MSPEREETPAEDQDDEPPGGRIQHHVGYGHAFEDERNVWS